MAALVALLALALGPVSACDDEPHGRNREPAGGAVEAPEELTLAELAGDAERGRALAERFECSRCHQGTGHPDPAPERDCVRCHQQIRAGTFDAPADVLARWRAHATSLLDAPSLAGARRLRRDWVASFLQRPHDLRPGLVASMPRLALDDAAARDLAVYLVPDQPARQTLPPRAELAAGRALMEAKGCAICHAFTGVPSLRPSPLPVEVDAAGMERALRLAPDLRFVRDRMQPARLVPWLLDPEREQPGTAMPKIPLTREEAERIAAYLVHAELGPAPRYLVPERLPVLEREVAFAEVSERVFRRICWHCHSDPAYAIGDGGPGNTGGFGFTGRGLNLARHQGIMSGMVDAQGERTSVFQRRPDGTPHLVAVLWARHQELAGEPVEGLRGMPLGFPPIAPEDIQLVETWIAQGRPE